MAQVEGREMPLHDWKVLGQFWPPELADALDAVWVVAREDACIPRALRNLRLHYFLAHRTREHGACEAAVVLRVTLSLGPVFPKGCHVSVRPGKGGINNLGGMA